MEDFLLRLLEMSLAGSIAAVIVMLARLALKRTPRAIVCALWIVVLFRLLCPFTIESAVGLFPAKEPPVQPQQVIYATPYSKDEPDFSNPAFVIPSPDSYTAPVIPVEDDVEPVRRIDWVHIGWVAGFAVWVIGVAVLIAHGIISLVRLRKRLQGAIRYDENVFIAKGLETAFVLGVLRPKIYLPDGLTERELSYILMHEHTHVRRGDHIFKLIGYCALSIHWFNPVAWLAFTLAERDLEMACDEAVIRRLGANVKKEYSASLLALATGRRIFSGMPLAFGEGDTKGRVKNVLKYKEPALWAVVIAVLIVVALCVGLACNQPQKTAMVRAEGAVYEWDGSVINKVPEGSRQIGMLKSVLQNRSKEPDLDMQGVNLDDQYVGCAMYTNDNGVLYLETADGSALLFRLTVSSGNTMVELNGSEFAALLNTNEPVDVFHTLQMENGSIFVGYYIGEEGDIGAACVTREGKDYALHSSGRINGMGTYEGTALVSLGIPDKSWYEVLIVTNPEIDHAICRNSNGYTTITMQDAPSVYAVDDEQTGTWEFYDKNGVLLEIKPSIMATETDSVAVEIIAPSDEAEDRVNALEFISNGEVMYLASALKDTVMGDYLDKIVLSSILKSAAWPAEDVLPDDYFVLTCGDVISGMQQHFVYMHPEFGRPVIQSGDYYTTFSDEDWELLQRIVAADEEPYIYTMVWRYGETELQEILLNTQEMRDMGEKLWYEPFISSTVNKKREANTLGDNYLLKRKYLNGTEETITFYQTGEVTLAQQEQGTMAFQIMQNDYKQLTKLFPKPDKIIADVDGDDLDDIAYWERPMDGWGARLCVQRGNGVRQTFSAEGIFAGTLLAADVTGDGLPEIIAMADTGGNGGMGSYALTILSFREGALQELPIPFENQHQYQSEDEPNWWGSGYTFEPSWEDGFRLRVKADLMDESIDYSTNPGMVKYLIETHECFEKNGELKRGYRDHSGSNDGICHLEVVNYGNTPGYELQVYQYLYMFGHSDGVGFGVTTIDWDEDAQAFIPVEQGWTRELGSFHPQLNGMDMNGDNAQDYVRIHHYASLPTLQLYFLKQEIIEKQLTDENWKVYSYADLTGDGKDEIILRASPRGNVIAEMWCILTYEDGELTELELPHQEEYEGYAYFLEYGRPYQSFRIYSEKLDTTIEFTDEQKQKLSKDETRYESQIHNDLKNNWIGTDGINDISIVQLDNGKYALDISQYLYSGSHMNGGIGEGCSRIAWNGKDFEVIDQWFLSRWHDDKRFPE